MGMFMIRDYEADTQFLYDCEREQQFNYDFDGSIYCAYSASGFGTLNDGGNCCVIDRDGNIVMQHSGHSIGMVSDDGYVIIDNSLYNVNDSSVINFTSYTLAHSAYFDGDYAVINLKSEEGEYYCTLLTKQGEFVFDPIPGEGSQCLEGGRFFVGYSGYNEHMVYCLDLQGKEIWRDNRGRDAHNLGEGIMMMYCPADEVYEFYTWDHEFLFNQVNYREE